MAREVMQHFCDVNWHITDVKCCFSARNCVFSVKRLKSYRDRKNVDTKAKAQVLVKDSIKTSSMT